MQGPGLGEEMKDVSCPAGVPVSGIGLETPSQTKTITARVLDATPKTAARFDNSWTVQFLDAQGAPLNDVTINNACAWMYVHQHGGPPMAVTQLSDPSTFELKALNLFMRGPWSIELAVSSPSKGGTPTQMTACDRNGKALGMDKIALSICVQDE